MTPASRDIAINAQILKRIRHDFPFFCERFLKIYDKDGNKVPLKLKPQQMDYWETELKPFIDVAMIRSVILKARQLGFSTLIQAFMLWMALTRPGRGCLVLTHKDDASQKLFEKIEIMYDELPAAYHDQLDRLKTSGKKGKQLSWGKGLGSTIRVDTAGNKTVGRSFTFQIVHASEAAFWEHYRRIFTSLMSSLGKRPGTIMIIETTANGTGTPFHKLWKRAKSGKSTWRPKFYPWQDDPDNAMEIPEDETIVWDRDERRIKRIYKLTDEQLYWRRVSIEDDFDGDIDMFHQENPMTDDEAFIVSGSPYFPANELQRLLDRCKPPIKKGRLVLENGKPMFVEEAQTERYEPAWWVWKRPERGHTYLIAGDPAGGTHRDACASHILDVKTLEVVATFRDNTMEPDDFADQLRWMGLSYGVKKSPAMVAPETNGEGRSTILRLVKKLRYPNLFYHVDADQWESNVTSRWGWRTSPKTRPVMLADLFRLINRRELKIYCERTIKEMMTFVRRPEIAGRVAEAAPGTHDDMVMSLAICTADETRTLAMMSTTTEEVA